MATSSRTGQAKLVESSAELKLNIADSYSLLKMEPEG
jgi:hypothetical protein